MGKVTVVKDKNYTCVTNQIFRDKRLSLKAVGLLMVMLSLPDDWDYTIAGLASIVKDGKSSVRTALNELEACGYLVRETIREESGRFADLDYIVYETPQFEEPESENRNAENRTQLNTYKQSTHKQSTKKESIQLSEFSLTHDQNTLFDSEILDKEITKAIQNNADDIGNEEEEDVARVIKYYYYKYFATFREEHPCINQKTMDGVVKRLLCGTDYIGGVDFEMYREMIDKHFKTRYKNCDYNIAHFMTDGIRNFKALETGNVSGGEMMMYGMLCER